MGFATGLTGLTLSAIEPVLEVEESVGLRIQYLLRDEPAPPDEVIVIAIDNRSAEQLGLLAELTGRVQLTGWPRELHARVIRRLHEAGAAIIALDVLFRAEGDPAADAALESAIHEAGSVILFQGTIDESEPAAEIGPGHEIEIRQVRRDRVLPSLREGALATAPFRLPAHPPSVNQYQAFVEEFFDAPQLPVVAFAALRNEAHTRLLAEAAAARPELAETLLDERLEESMAAMRRTLRADPALAAALLSRIEQSGDAPADAGLIRDISMLLELYARPDSRYFNLYGGPRTITTIPVHEVLQRGLDPDIAWEGAAVLIGYSDETYANQADTFQTFFTASNALQVSGVELAATALANFIQNRPLRAAPIAWHLALVVLLGAAFGASFAPRSAFVSIAAFGLVVGGYFIFVRTQFDFAYIWWPFVVPLMIQAPLALVLGLWHHYARARAQHASVTHGASHYLPAELVARLSENPGSPARSTELVEGTCLVTDIENYTAYSESMPPRELERALNAYYDALFGIVDRHGGLVTDIVGDSMVSVWRGTGETEAPGAGPIRAALEIGEHLASLRSTFPRTRVGLNAGEFVLGTVGARRHLEYRAVGDIVNSAARIQVLNKTLGTTVLAARHALPATNVAFRHVGSFLLTGKQQVLDICEPIGLGTAPSDSQRLLLEGFEHALSLFREGQWERALAAFEDLLQRMGDDGPSHFYIRYITDRLANTASGPRDGIIRLPV